MRERGELKAMNDYCGLLTELVHPEIDTGNKGIDVLQLLDIKETRDKTTYFGIKDHVFLSALSIYINICKQQIISNIYKKLN